MTRSYGLSRDGPLASVAGDEPTIRGVVHDLGHQIMTISLLAESVRGDACLPSAARRQADLLVQETARAICMITDLGPASGKLPGAATALVDVRELAARTVRLIRLEHQATVRLLPGPPAYMQVDPMVVCRVLRNVADNAARAAGPHGTVEISIRRGAGTIIEVTDTGPGFDRLPHETAGLGLSVVRELLAAAGGQLEVSARPQGGTSVRAVFGSQSDRIVVPRLRGTWAAIA